MLVIIIFNNICILFLITIIFNIINTFLLLSSDRNVFFKNEIIVLIIF